MGIPGQYSNLAVARTRSLDHPSAMSTTAMIYWEDPIQTGVLFGSVLVILTSLSYCSLLSVVAYSALTLLAVVMAVKLYNFVMVKTGKTDGRSDPLVKVAELNLTVSESHITSHADCIAESINWVASRAKSLVLMESHMDTVKFTLCLYGMTYIGAWFNALTLVILAWVGFFTLPKIYLNNQTQVDEVMDKVMAQVEEIKAKVVNVLPANMKPAVVVHKKEE